MSNIEVQKNNLLGKGSYGEVYSYEKWGNKFGVKLFEIKN